MHSNIARGSTVEGYWVFCGDPNGNQEQPWSEMSFTKQAEIQRSAVENAEELQFYLRDLKQWEAEIKCKDRELLGQKSAVTGDEGEINVETVRGDKNSSNKTASVEKRKKKKSDKKKQPKIPSYDYAAWDKFNVVS